MMIYSRLVAAQIRSQLQYRTSFILELLSNALMMTLFFISLRFMFDRFGSLGGWSLGEVAFLYGLVDISFGLMDMIFSGFDPDYFGQFIRRGAFDQLLLRPVSLFTQVLGSQFVLRRFGRIIEGVAVFIYALSLLSVEWTVGKIFYLPWVVVGQICFFGGLFMVGATITFWTVETTELMNMFTYGGSELIAYPMHIYQGWMRRFFTYIIPAAFINYFPALYFLDKTAPFPVPAGASFLAPLAGFFLLGLALAFWQYGINHYQSTGS